MRPADQRLHATYDPGGQLGLGLILDAKLSDLNRAARLADQRQPLGVAIASCHVNLVAGPYPLGLLHRDVSALQQAERVACMGGEHRDATTRVDVNGDVPDLERPLQSRMQPQRSHPGRRFIAGRERHRELIAAEPRERVFPP